MKWTPAQDGCSIIGENGWSIARYPGKGREPANGEIVYLLFRKRMNATGERYSGVADRRAVPFADLEKRAAAIVELKNAAEK